MKKGILKRQSDSKGRPVVNMAEMGGIDTRPLSRRGSNMVTEFTSFINKRRNSSLVGDLTHMITTIGRPKAAKQKRVTFYEVVINYGSNFKSRLAPPEEPDRIELDPSDFEDIDIEELEYDFLDLVNFSIEMLDATLFETITRNFPETFCQEISEGDLEYVLTKVMISGDIMFANLVIDFVRANFKSYNNFHVLSPSFFRKRIDDALQPMLLTLVHQGDVEMVKLAIDSGFDLNELNATVAYHGDVVSSQWLKQNKTPEGDGKKKRRKRWNPMKFTEKINFAR